MEEYNVISTDKVAVALKMVKRDPHEDLVHKLASQAQISRNVLTLPHPAFDLELKDELLMVIFKNEEIQDYFSGLHNYVQSISYVELMELCAEEDGNMDWFAEMSKLNFMAYDENNIDHQVNVLCHILYGYYRYAFSKLEDIFSVTKKIPAEIYISALNKKKGTKVVYRTNEAVYGGVLDGIEIRRSFFGTSVRLYLNVVVRGRDGYIDSRVNFSLPYVPYVEKPEDLGISLLDDELHSTLTERGRKYLKYTQTPSYCSCKGFASRYGGWMGDIRLSINGRVMIDISAMRNLNSNIDDYWYKGQPFSRDSNSMGSSNTIQDDKLWMCIPEVYGFTFGNKEWVRMFIDDISEIEFSNASFNELIVPDTYKDIFIASLTHDVPSLDSIEGKGNGKVFLLYGPPGCGKTLTAESVAEYLKKPLYYVSVGELGTTPNEMEGNLSRVMDVAISWDAVVLLDEVDVFAIKRDNTNIQRNAMTAILLRLLERYDGIIFMTTNLIENLDPAFISRTTPIPYNALGINEKCTIWKSLLRKAEAAGIGIDKAVYESISDLASFDLNGREIKNNIRLAYTLALSSNGKNMTLDNLMAVLRLRQLNENAG